MQQLRSVFTTAFGAKSVQVSGVEIPVFCWDFIYRGLSEAVNQRNRDQNTVAGVSLVFSIVSEWHVLSRLPASIEDLLKKMLEGCLQDAV